MLINLKLRLLGTLLAAVAVAGGPALFGGEPVAKDAKGVAGIVKAVDADKNTITVVVTVDKDEEKSYTLAKDAAVSLMADIFGHKEKDAKLGEVKAGMLVRIEVTDDNQAAKIKQYRKWQTRSPAKEECPKCKGCWGCQLNRSFCESEDLWQKQKTCWCELAQFQCPGPSKKEHEETLDKGYAEAKKAGKLVLFIGNTGG